jgi:hypothetical protein
MKLGAAVPVLNEWRFIPAVTGQLGRVVDRLVLVRPFRSQSRAPVRRTPLPRLHPGTEVIEGDWPTEADTRNAGLNHLSECDYVFMVDSDEILLDRDLEILKDICQSRLHWVIGAPWVTCWKTAAIRIDPPHPGSIHMVLRRGVRIRGIREASVPAVHVADVCCRHLGYVRTDEELLEKLRLATHAAQVPGDWFECVWKGWDINPSLENLYPVTGQESYFKRAVRFSDPELLAVLDRWGCA